MRLLRKEWGASSLLLLLLLLALGALMGLLAWRWW
jgi:hypothetical protein